MFSSLMPKRNEFFELLAAHSDLVVAGGNAALRLVNGLGQGSEDIPALAAEVNFNEKAADKIKAELIGLLHKSFTTPINRDQIHTLTIELDLVLNALKEVANSVNMYNITESTAEVARTGLARRRRLHAPEPWGDRARFQGQGAQGGNAQRLQRDRRPRDARPTPSSARRSASCSTARTASGRRSRCASSTRCRKTC